MTRAMITGVKGQDGSYLAEHLMRLEYEVFGVARTNNGSGLANIQHLMTDSRFHLLDADMADETALQAAVDLARPDEVYNCAGQASVPQSWIDPATTIDVNFSGLARLLKTLERSSPCAKVCQASSGEIFGNVTERCNEITRLAPETPYGAAKLGAHLLCGIYRRKGMFVCSAILFNHESPRRHPEMVTRKIAKAVANWKSGGREPLFLGCTTATRDWGFAGDYVRAMHLMLQQSASDDFVIGTGLSHSVQDFIDAAVSAANLDFCPIKAGLICDDQSLGRPNAVNHVSVDARKAWTDLRWTPQIGFDELVGMLTAAELEHL